MRRMLSGLLATAMVASVCATASFAASEVDATPAEVRITFGDIPVIPTDANGDYTVEEISVVVTLPAGGQITLTAPVPPAGTPTTTTQQWASYIARAADFTVSSDAKFGNGAKMRKNDLFVTADKSSVVLATKVAGKDVEFSEDAGTGNGVDIAVYGFDGTKDPTLSYRWPKHGVNTDADVTNTDNLDNISIRDILVCDTKGQPLPLTEDRNGVNRDQNDGDGVQSGQTVYFMIRDDVKINGRNVRFDDSTFWKLKISKGDNGKYISEISDTTKTFGDDLYSVYTHSQVPGTGGSRNRYIKVKMSEIMTDDEFKVTLDMRLTAKSKAVDVIGSDFISDDEELKVDDFYFYVQNITKRADGEWKVGTGGMMLDPVKNDWNEVTYIDEDKDVAFMKFFGDSDTGKFYAKLSTKWEHADYASYFNDQDAYIFQFTGSPSLSSTSRADLQLYSPFVDEDGNETFDPQQAVIYQVVDGDLFDITDNFTYEEGENGDMAYCTRVRFLGTFIICQKPVEEASSDDVVDLVPDDLVPDNNTGAPVEVNPGNNNGGSGSKAPANTGKF